MALSWLAGNLTHGAHSSQFCHNGDLVHAGRTKCELPVIALTDPCGLSFGSVEPAFS